MLLQERCKLEAVMAKRVQHFVNFDLVSIFVKIPILANSHGA